MRKNTWLSKAIAVILSVSLLTTGAGISYADEEVATPSSPAIEAGNNDGVPKQDQSTAADNKEAVENKETANAEVTEDQESTASKTEVPAEEAAPESRTLQDPRASVTITNILQLATLFPDENFRTVVFEAVKDGQDGAVGSTVEEAFANFTGDIKANKKGITKAEGLQYLQKATSVDLRHNEIEEWSFLGNTSKDYYGGTDDEGSYYNVAWNIGGNPFRTLPADFGGRLVIAQAGTTAYTYSEELAPSYSYVRGTKEFISGDINIAKTVVKKPDGTQRDASVESVEWNKHGGGSTTKFKIDWTEGNNKKAHFSELKKSGIAYVAVGIDQELHYQTSDENDTITPGSQSFKYYLPNKFWVYDKVTVTDNFTGSAKLTKTDAANKTKVLAGAKFSLFKENGELVQANGRVPNVGV